MQKGICFVSWVPPLSGPKNITNQHFFKGTYPQNIYMYVDFCCGIPRFSCICFFLNRMSQYCYRVYRLVSNGGGYKSITQKASHHLEKTSHTRAMLRPFARDTSRNILPNQTNTFLRPASPNPLLFHIQQVLKLILELL